MSVDSLFTRELIGLVSVLIGLIGTGVYILSIFQGKTKPHLYTHLIWGILCGIGFAAQIHDGAGPGSWALGLSTAGCFITVVLSLKWGEKNITRGDKIALAASLSAMIPWLLTDDPLGSVILISFIDAVAFYPTFRKSWMKPHEENLTSYNVANMKMVLALFALENFTITSSLYVMSVIFFNGSFVLMCLWRRKVLKPSGP